MKLGIPNTLFSSYHLEYWCKFAALLNLEIVISEASNQTIADLGCRLLPHEFCLPVKVFMGHIVKLMEEKVDLLLLPIMSGRKRRDFFCPKLLGLAEIVKYSVGVDEECCFAPEISCNGLRIELIKPPRQKLVSGLRWRQIEGQADHYWQMRLRQCRTEKITLGSIGRNLQLNQAGAGVGLTLGLLGYAYTLYDPFISKDILSKLTNLGVAVRTWEMVEPSLIEEGFKTLKSPLYWNFGKIICGAGLYFLQDPAIDGVIYVSTFGCGPDSVVTNLLSGAAGELQKPLLLLNLDEHAETGHLQTRLEAFTEMLAERKEQARGA
jgi:predicted nucleotide-binding protein (sugar kinase/HSP70/actin superfamily)